MTEHLFGFISSIVAGIVTNGIKGVSHYITKENLQDHITNTIGTVQSLYEKEFGCKDKSLFIWQKNIEYYALWLWEELLSREDAVPPVPYSEDQEQNITQEEIGKFHVCNLIGTTLPDGSCFDTQRDQEEHLNALMQEYARNI